MNVGLAIFLAVLIGIALGSHAIKGKGFKIGPLLLAVLGAWVCLEILLWIDWTLRSTFNLWVIVQLTLLLLPLHLLLALPAGVACAVVQWVGPRTGETSMSILRAFGIIVASGAGFGIAGCLLGYLLGVGAPGYYRSVFRNGNDPHFDPVATGIGLGLTQGLTAGLVVGAVVVVAVAWYRSRASGPTRHTGNAEPVAAPDPARM